MCIVGARFSPASLATGRGRRNFRRRGRRRVGRPVVFDGRRADPMRVEHPASLVPLPAWGEGTDRTDTRRVGLSPGCGGSVAGDLRGSGVGHARRSRQHRHRAGHRIRHCCGRRRDPHSCARRRAYCRANTGCGGRRGSQSPASAAEVLVGRGPCPCRVHDRRRSVRPTARGECRRPPGEVRGDGRRGVRRSRRGCCSHPRRDNRSTGPRTPATRSFRRN